MHRTPYRSSLAPALGRASALTIPWVVNALSNSPCDGAMVSRRPMTSEAEEDPGAACYRPLPPRSTSLSTSTGAAKTTGAAIP